MEQRNKLYVGNFPFSWKEDDLEQVFSDFKDSIVDIKIIYDQFSGRSKGFAFVTFNEDQAAKEAIERVADTKAGDRTLVVSHARPPSQRASFDRGGRGGGGGGGGGSGRERRGGGYDR